MAAVFVVAGCARQDWIDRTLVTVDVTGTWSGYIKGTSTGGSREVTFELRQEGPKVTGVVNGIGFHGRELSGPIEGSIAGDRFEFRRPNSTFRGEMTVNGDEMTGQTHGGAGPRKVRSFCNVPTQHSAQQNRDLRLLSPRPAQL